MMSCDRPVLKAFRAVAVSYSDYLISKDETRSEAFSKRLRDIRSTYVYDLKPLSCSQVMLSDCELEFDCFVDAVKAIAFQGLDVRPQAVASEAESIALKVERMLNPTA